ncbi:MAG TPA: hypothetical protein VFS40_12835 [Gemmatimonadales bacterium]|nr:hypothetical protein [Gemmatimonadales bacterium]
MPSRRLSPRSSFGVPRRLAPVLLAAGALGAVRPTPVAAQAATLQVTARVVAVDAPLAALDPVIVTRDSSAGRWDTLRRVLEAGTPLDLHPATSAAVVRIRPEAATGTAPARLVVTIDYVRN